MILIRRQVHERNFAFAPLIGLLNGNISSFRLYYISSPESVRKLNFSHDYYKITILSDGILDLHISHTQQARTTQLSKTRTGTYSVFLPVNETAAMHLAYCLFIRGATEYQIKTKSEHL